MLRSDMSREVLVVAEGPWTLVACEGTRVFLEMFVELTADSKLFVTLMALQALSIFGARWPNARVFLLINRRKCLRHVFSHRLILTCRLSSFRRTVFPSR
jgi:hypothetical protein